MQLEKRVVAFVDLLGFEATLRKAHSSDDQDELERVYTKILSVFREVILPESSRSTTLASEARVGRGGEISGVEVNFFSDSVVISAPCAIIDSSSVVLERTLRLGRALLLREFPARAGLAQGRCYHQQGIVFGEAMLKAYHLESKVAGYPRLAIERAVGESLLNRGIELEESKDGLFYVDWFSTVGFMEESAEELEELRKALEKGLKEVGHLEAHRPDIVAKWVWLQNICRDALGRLFT